MKFTPTDFEGLFLIRPELLSDARGWFMECFSQKNFPVDVQFVQDNESCSSKNVLRGLHFQVPPFAQAKLVRVTNGSVLDVVVDLRKNEPTFGKHFSLVLSSENITQLFIPAGFAHGFLVLEDDTVFSYKCSGYYHRDSDRVLRWNDPGLAIDWGIASPKLSDKDGNAPLLKDFDSPF